MSSVVAPTIAAANHSRGGCHSSLFPVVNHVRRVVASVVMSLPHAFLQQSGLLCCVHLWPCLLCCCLLPSCVTVLVSTQSRQSWRRLRHRTCRAVVPESRGRRVTQGTIAREDGCKAQLWTATAGHASRRAPVVPPLPGDNGFDGLLKPTVSNFVCPSCGPGTARLSSR